jgi:hypothetical protein
MERMAESQGFEPRDLVKGQRFSRPPHSTALPTLRAGITANLATVLYQKLKILSTLNSNISSNSHFDF